jgi:hypothetical protein
LLARDTLAGPIYRSWRQLPSWSSSTQKIQFAYPAKGTDMKHLIIVAALALTCANAVAATSCEQLKTEIAAKIDAKGVKDYTLDIVPNDQVGDQKVVGSCDGGTKKIVYAKK